MFLTFLDDISAMINCSCMFLVLLFCYVVDMTITHTMFVVDCREKHKMTLMSTFIVPLLFYDKTISKSPDLA